MVFLKDLKKIDEVFLSWCPRKVDEGKGYLSRIVCFKYIGLLYHLIGSIRDMVSSYSLWFSVVRNMPHEYISGNSIYPRQKLVETCYKCLMLQSQKYIYICIYNLCTLYSNNNKAIPIITYRICVYGAYTYAYMCTCMCVFKIVLRAALWNGYIIFYWWGNTSRERQDTQDPKVRREHDQTSRLCSESPHNLVACLWNMPYSIFTAASTSVVWPYI